MEKLNPAELLKQYHSAKRRMLLLNYEGTLVSDHQAATDRTVERIIADLSTDPKNSVVIISDSSVAALTDCFLNNSVTLVAESGGFMRSPRGEWQALGDLYMMWKEPVVTALRRLAASYPGTSIAEKHFSVKWIFHNGGTHLSDNDRKQLNVAFRMLSNQFDVPLNQTDNWVEFRTAEVNKGKFAASWMNLNGPSDFILAMGADSSDEALFDSIGKSYTTVRVGYSSASQARYYIESRSDVLPLLEQLIQIRVKQNLS
jgi:trehalose 6-phosphate synthase/phosphatase